MTSLQLRTPTIAAIVLAITTSLFADPATSGARPKFFAVTVTGTGQPMILIPGLESSGEVWNGVVDHFQDRYQIHVLTLAGFAGQPRVAGLRLADVKAEIIAYVREHRLDHPVIGGNSLGGFLALWLASSAPDLFGRVISVDGVPFLPALMNPTATAQSSKADAEKFRAMYSSMKADQLAAASKMALTYMMGDPKKSNLR